MSEKSMLELMSEVRAEALWHQSPEAALSGQRLTSAETDPDMDTSLAIANLALEQPERFRELVGFLPLPIQDIFFQSYLLGRTQAQIGRLLEWNQSPGVWQRHRMGLEGMCAIIAWGGPPPDEDWVATGKEKKLLDAYMTMEAFRRRWKGLERLELTTPRTLGEFVVRIDDPAFEEFFARGTTDGPVGRHDD